MAALDIEIKRVRIFDLLTITRMAYANMTGVDQQFTQLVRNPIGRFMGYFIFPFYFGLTGDGYKAVAGGKIIGCAYLYLNKNSGYVFNVNVNQGYRRQGVARQLMAHLEEITRSRRRSLLVLQVEDANLPAKRLYEELGFRSYHPHFLRTNGAIGLRQAVESAVSLESLNNSWGRRFFLQYQSMERRAGDGWAYEALKDYQDREGDSGRYWRCLLNGEEVGAVWERKSEASFLLTLALKPEFWGHLGQTGFVKQVLDQSGIKRPYLDLHFGSSPHHEAAVAMFERLGFEEMVQSRLLMVKRLDGGD